MCTSVPYFLSLLDCSKAKVNVSAARSPKIQTKNYGRLNSFSMISISMCHCKGDVCIQDYYCEDDSWCGDNGQCNNYSPIIPQIKMSANQSKCFCDSKVDSFEIENYLDETQENLNETEGTWDERELHLDESEDIIPIQGKHFNPI